MEVGNVARRVNLCFSKVIQKFFYNFKLLVLTCVKVGENGIYSEGIFPYHSSNNLTTN